MIIRKAGKGNREESLWMFEYISHWVCRNEGTEDQTELDAADMKDLEMLWKSLCSEFNCKANSVLYVEIV